MDNNQRLHFQTENQRLPNGLHAYETGKAGAMGQLFCHWLSAMKIKDAFHKSYSNTLRF